MPSRPLTLGYLLDLIQVVMHPDDAIATSSIVTPPYDLDVAQTILVRWGDTIFWSWETWDDSRLANSEVIVFLVRTDNQVDLFGDAWLHLDGSMDK